MDPTFVRDMDATITAILREKGKPPTEIEDNLKARAEKRQRDADQRKIWLERGYV
jgi:hypothetical protein